MFSLNTVSVDYKVTQIAKAYLGKLPKPHGMLEHVISNETQFFCVTAHP